jgi:hypothetical protein
LAGTCEPNNEAAGVVCEDDEFCTINDTCDGVGDCSSGNANPCDDGVDCTNDSCDEANDQCVNTPNDGNCDNNLFCDGTETCDPVNDCQAGTDPCVAWESCNEAGDVCVLLPVIFSEDFEVSVPGWTIINNNQNNAVWSYDNPGNRDNYAGTGDFAIADSDKYNNKDMDTELRTPLLNLSSLITVFLEFKTDFYVYDNIFSGNEIADVDVSTNGISGPWTNVWRKTSNYFEATEVVEITTLAAGHTDVMIRFHYYDAYNDWWWQIDDVKIRGFCMDSDSDGTDDCNDGCPSDPEKIEPGVCGCGVSDTDSDSDGVADCNDICPGFDDTIDTDTDGVPDGCDACPGFDDSADADADGVPDGCDNCPSDPGKIEPGVCGCGVSDVDSDGDGIADCNDICPGFDDSADADADGVPDGCDNCPGFDDFADEDSDGVPDGCDNCPSDPDKTEPGICGCGASDVDSDGDSIADCDDICPGYDDSADADADGVPDGCDNCPSDPEKIEPGVCGCGVADPDVGDIQNLVILYYQSILDRDPEQGGAEGWASEIERIVSLGIDVKEGFIALGKLFFNSEEYIDMVNTDESYIIDLYETFLGRTPSGIGEEVGEVDDWMAELEGGLTRNLLLNYFIFSEEFRTYMEGIFGSCPVWPEYSLVNDLYRGFLSRLPDNSGFNSWLALMQEAQCTGEQAVRDLTNQIGLDFIHSPEYEARNPEFSNPDFSSEFVTNLYDAVLRRGAELTGYLDWKEQYDSDTLTKEEILQFFVNSDEFQGRVQEVIDAGCSLP